MSTHMPAYFYYKVRAATRNQTMVEQNYVLRLGRTRKKIMLNVIKYKTIVKNLGVKILAM